MPGGRTKFSNVWLSAIDSSGQKLSSWCCKGLDDFHVYCRFRDSEFLCDNSGKSQIFVGFTLGTKSVLAVIINDKNNR